MDLLKIEKILDITATSGSGAYIWWRYQENADVSNNFFIQLENIYDGIYSYKVSWPSFSKSGIEVGEGAVWKRICCIQLQSFVTLVFLNQILRQKNISTIYHVFTTI